MEKKIDELKPDEIEAVVGGVKTMVSKDSVIIMSVRNAAAIDASSSSVSQQIDASSKR